MDDIAGWRQRIDEIDARLLGLLNERAACAIEIGRIKQKTGREVYDPAREKTVIDRLRSLNTGPLSDDAVQGLFECLIRESRQLEQNE